MILTIISVAANIVTILAGMAGAIEYVKHLIALVKVLESDRFKIGLSSIDCKWYDKPAIIWVAVKSKLK